MAKYGTNGNDYSIYNPSGDTVYAGAGNDSLGGRGISVGGGGADTYGSAGSYEWAMIYDAVASDNDTLTINYAFGFYRSTTHFAIIDGKHLYGYDTSSHQHVIIANWQTEDGRIEKYNFQKKDYFSIESYTTEEIAARFAAGDHFDGYINWEQLQAAGSPFGDTARINDLLAEIKQEAIRMESGWPTISIQSRLVYEGGEHGLVLTLSEPVTFAGQVDLAIVPGSATRGEDFEFSRTTITIRPGQTTYEIDYTLYNDLIAEGDEIFTVKLVNPGGVIIGQDTAVVTIRDNDSYNVSISDATIVEGDTYSDLVFKVKLDRSANVPITVHYAELAGAGTATAGEDYEVITPGTLTFSPGVKEQTIAVRVKGDILSEYTETVLLSLTDADAATIKRSEATGTIKNDDLPIFSPIDAIMASEGSGSGNVSVFHLLNLAGVVQTKASIRYEMVAVTATPGADFTPISGTLVFDSGGALLKYSIINDTDAEAPEVFDIVFSDPKGLVIVGDGRVRVTIEANDGPAVTIDDAIADEDDGSITFNVNLYNWNRSDLTLNWRTVADTAIRNADYVGRTGTLIPGSSDKTASIQLDLVDDDKAELTEQFFIEFYDSNGNVRSRERAIGTITDSDPVRLLATSTSVVEGDAPGITHALVPLRLDHALPNDVTVTWRLVSGTAKGGRDFVAASGTLVIPAGQTAGSIPVDIIGDQVREKAETLTVEMTVTGAPGTQSLKTVVTIQDDEGIHRGTDGPDSLVGDAGGPDSMDGGGGRDTLDGGSGNDTILGGDGDDVIFGGSAADVLVGGDGNDNLDGGSDRDNLQGGAGADTIYGRDGTDTIAGGADADSIAGGAGADLIYGGDGDDQMIAGAGDTIYGDTGNDTIMTDRSDQSSGRVTRIYGGEGNDSLRGGVGSDSIFGEAGNDSIDSRSGNDSMWGGAGRDQFLFLEISGADRIGDFQVGEDKILLDTSGGKLNGVVLRDIDLFLQEHASTVGRYNNDTLLDLGGGNTVLLIGVKPAMLDADDFMLV